MTETKHLGLSDIDIMTIAYSTPCWRCTGASNVKLVATDPGVGLPSSAITGDTSLAVNILVTFEKGMIVLLGMPAMVGTKCIVTGISGS